MGLGLIKRYICQNKIQTDLILGFSPKNVRGLACLFIYGMHTPFKWEIAMNFLFYDIYYFLQPKTMLDRVLSVTVDVTLDLNEWNWWVLIYIGSRWTDIVVSENKF